MLLATVLFSGPYVMGTAGAQSTKYGVTVQVAKTASLAAAKTYSWTTSQPSPDKTVDARIVAAVDRELSALGLTKVAPGISDLVATYAAMARTDTDMKSKADKSGARTTFPAGTLIVDLRDRTTRDPLFRVRMDTPIDAERDTIGPVIDAAVAAMFEKYPARVPAKR